MINYEGMKSEEQKSVGRFDPLPAGPYVAVVMDTRVEGQAPDQQLAIVMDVSEGDYKGYFMNRYTHDKDAGSKYDVKFKGVYRLRIPNPNNKNAKYPESDVSRMNDMIYRFEKSNNGFHWDGDEKKLKGLTVGINMQEAEYNGNAYTRIGRLEIAQDVRAGLVKAMKPKKSQDRPAEIQDPTTGFTQVETPVPF